MIFFDSANNNSDIAGNLLDLISILIGLENLVENRQQSADNDVNVANQKQAKEILDDLHQQFDKQNAMLEYQNKLLKQILNILKGEIKNELL